MFSFICARINGWVNNREAGDLKYHRAHYDVTVMVFKDDKYSFVINFRSQCRWGTGGVKHKKTGTWWIPTKPPSSGVHFAIEKVSYGMPVSGGKFRRTDMVQIQLHSHAESYPVEDRSVGLTRWRDDSHGFRCWRRSSHAIIGANFEITLLKLWDVSQVTSEVMIGIALWYHHMGLLPDT